MIERRAVTVSELNHYIKEIVSEDGLLSALWVQGEISNLKYHSSGHIYFSLKDSAATVKCVMFRSRSAFLKFRLEDGMKVQVFGNIDVFERDGVYQLYASRIEPDGIGALYAAFEQLKTRLAKEGLFEESHKKKRPLLPRCVGVLTSPTGAVLQDIRNVAGRRFAGIPILVYPIPVQGREAAPIIAQTIERAGSEGKCDVLILARGGGSLEDLWPFNEECVARAIYACPVPLVSAVGHETDFTIADFVGERAPTPSAAAEIVFPEKEKLRSELMHLYIRLSAAPGVLLRDRRAELERLKAAPLLKHPEEFLLQKRNKIDEAGYRLDMAAGRMIAAEKTRLAGAVKAVGAFHPGSLLARNRAGIAVQKEKLLGAGRYFAEVRRGRIRLLSEKLAALGPESVLARGYTIALAGGTDPITSVKDIRPGAVFTLVTKDGNAEASFTEEPKSGAPFSSREKGCLQN